MYAVETKGKYKPDRKRGELDYTVIFDGKRLHFSDVFHTDQPLKQAQRNAVGFSKWLSSAVGEDIKAMPVVALPGWWIKFDSHPQNGKLYNGKLENDKGQFDISKMKKSFFITGNMGQPPLSPGLFKRIVHQLDQKCRDVQPLAYRSE